MQLRGVAVVAVFLAATCLLSSIPAARAGSVHAAATGYHLTYTNPAGGVSNPAVDLIALSSTDLGGPNISVTFTVAGALNLSSPAYFYSVYFGDPTATYLTADAWFSNNTSEGYYGGLVSSGSGQPGNLPYEVAGGSTLSFSIAKLEVGPPTNLAVGAEARFFNGTSSADSMIGGENDIPCPGGTSFVTCSGLPVAHVPVDWWAVGWGWGVLGAIVGSIVLVLALLLAPSVLYRPPEDLSQSDAQNPPPPPVPPPTIPRPPP